MSFNPLRKMKRRFGAAIDWRVRDAIELSEGRLSKQLHDNLEAATSEVQASMRYLSNSCERLEIDLAEIREPVVVAADSSDRLAASLSDISTSLMDVSTSLTDQHRALSQLLEQLDRRVTALE